ncbi:MAG: DinB family protein [Planctomycetota bacterium]
MIEAKKALDYEAWALARLFDRLRELSERSADAERLLAHMVAGLDVWQLRLRGRDSTAVEIWPEPGELSELATRARSVLDGYRQFLDEAGESALDRTIEYTNQHGLGYTTSARDIVFHIMQHGHYHRGQINRALRQRGDEPVNCDYITYVRELAGQDWVP